MKRYKKWTAFAYMGELFLLLLLLIMVVKWVPDFGKKPSETGFSSEESSVPGEIVIDSETQTELETEENPEFDSEEETGDFVYRKPQSSNRNPGKTEETEESYLPPKMLFASDLHYLSPTMTDYGSAFQEWVEGEDGKVLRYSDEITDAFLSEAEKQNPQVLILSGDLSLNSEKVNHGELARKLRKFQKNGTQVLVIPGNHDISHPWAASYYGEERVASTDVDADGFYEIYHEFGYDQASDRDETSLSYLYELDDHYWIMMLDSVHYIPRNDVWGEIRKGTLKWMEECLKRAKEQGVTVIPVAHHNLLKESAVYRDNCTIKNNKEVIRLLEKFELPVFVSGHMHLQRIQKHIENPLSEGQYGIYEIVSNSLTTPPCQYGIMEWSEDGSMSYRTKTVDVETWAAENAKEDENLLHFASYSEQFLKEIVSDQIYKRAEGIPKERRREMADLYGEANRAYCAGTPVNRREIKKSETYFFWERYLGTTRWFEQLNSILKDTVKDHNTLKLKAGAKR